MSDGAGPTLGTPEGATVADGGPSDGAEPVVDRRGAADRSFGVRR